MQKGALSLLNVYGENSSSEDEVPFGRVSTKRSHKSDSDEEGPSKIKQPPIKFSLPNYIKLEKEEYIDDPSLHEGRIRSFPHERGNWASYIYIAYENNEDVQLAIEKICNKLEEYNFKYLTDLHISLTKVVVLRHHWIESFINNIKENITNINHFIIMFNGLNVYCNEERTRTFIGFEIKTGYDSLLELVTILNKCLAEYNLPKFYECASFHMSVAWCAGDVEDAIRSILPQLNLEITEMKSKFDTNYYILVDRIHCKVGNKFFTFHIS